MGAIIEVIPINKAMIPYTFMIKLGGETFELGIGYNAVYDYFTVDLFKKGETLTLGDKVVYGRPLWHGYADERYPNVAVIPWDMSQKQARVGWKQLGNSVLLILVRPEEVESG